jgi:hypothetical protein
VIHADAVGMNIELTEGMERSGISIRVDDDMVSDFLFLIADKELFGS